MIREDRHLYEFGTFRVDPNHRLLLRENRPIPLQPKAFDILLALIRSPDDVVSKDDLLKMVWPETFVEEANLAQNISVLRKALGELKGENRYIVTVPGKGYRFAEPVRFLSVTAGLPAPVEAVEDLAVERTRAHVVIEGGSVDQKALESVLTAHAALQILPRPLQEMVWYKRRIAALLILAGALGGGLLVWFFFRPAPLPRVLRSVEVTHLGRVEPYGQLLTDGPRIFFAERIDGTERLAQVSQQGGDASLIPISVRGIALQDIDRRTGRLLVTSTHADIGNNSLWILRTSGGSGQRVGDASAESASWSPDGRQIVYSQRGDLFLVGEDGLHPHQLFSVPGTIEHLRWSPDGFRISFTVRQPATTLSLWEISPDGSNPHVLPLGWKDPSAHWAEGECCGEWSPDSRYFIFRSSREGVHSLWAMRREKWLFNNGWFHEKFSAPVQLYTSPHWNEPTFSADGKKILLVSFAERRELARYDTATRQFVPYLGGIPVFRLSFSQDGQWVAYINEKDNTLWRSRVDGTQALQLTFPPLDAEHSSWSPDGKKIVFQANGTLYIVPTEGGKSEHLLPENISGGQPSWSPDGSAISFTVWNGNNPSTLGLFELGARRFQAIPNSETFEGPHWSPDGKYIAATDRKDKQLMMFDLSRRTWSALSDGTPNGWTIRWSSDSKYVYYQHTWAEQLPIYRVRISDRKVEEITSLQEIRRADVLSYGMTGLTPDNSPVVSLVPANSDIHALELALP